MNDILLGWLTKGRCEVSALDVIVLSIELAILACIALLVWAVFGGKK